MYTINCKFRMVSKMKLNSVVDRFDRIKYDEGASFKRDDKTEFFLIKITQERTILPLISCVDHLELPAFNSFNHAISSS